MANLSSLYTVSRCKNDDTLYGPSHGSDNGYDTICGQKLDHHWYITNNTFDGIITCKKCIKKLKNKFKELQKENNRV